MLICTIVIVGGSLTWTTGYALNLRSASYRAEVEADLAAFFELPCEIGRIRGQTFSSRAFDDVVIWLPDRRDVVFSCAEAVWHEFEEADPPARELELLDGVLVLGSDRWRQGDYEQVLRSGLGHDFEDLHLRRVDMQGFEIVFDRGGLSIRCRDTSGSLDLSDPAAGIARLQAYELNGCSVRQGVQIHARFKPEAGVEVSELILNLPPVPLSSLGLDRFLGGAVQNGRFEGRLEYVDECDPPELWLSGRIEGAELTELTRGTAIGPFEGRFSVDVDGARMMGNVLTHLRGRGRVDDLRFESFAPLLGMERLGGRASVNIDAVDLAMSRINRLRFSGLIEGMSVQDLLVPLRQGEATGRLTVSVYNVDIADDRIRSADIEFRVDPPEGEKGIIDRSLLLAIADRFFDFQWPAALPERLVPEKVEYARFGMRLLVRDNRLRILGTHGATDQTILTIRVFGRDFGIVSEPEGSTDLTPILSGFLEKVRRYDAGMLRDWWRRQAADRGDES